MIESHYFSVRTERGGQANRKSVLNSCESNTHLHLTHLRLKVRKTHETTHPQEHRWVHLYLSYYEFVYLQVYLALCAY